MKFIDIVKEKQADWYGKRQPTIAFMGDSITHGCFDVFVKNGKIETYVESENAYHEKVKEIFRNIYPDVPVITINAGISGDSASNGISRLERDVLSFKPDLVVVCYGTNDAMGGSDGLVKYIDSLEKIFMDIKKTGAEVIFMTPSIRTDKLEVRFSEELLNKIANEVADNENSGYLSMFLDEARKLCKKLDVPVCDCHKIWQKLKDNDVNVNVILSNRINHPTEKMHWLFAYELVRTMFEA